MSSWLFAVLSAVSLASGSRVETVRMDRVLESRGRLGGVSVGVDGSVYLSDFGRMVWRVSPQGEASVLDSSLRGSSGNAVDAEGNLYQASFSDNRIVRIRPDGAIDVHASTGLEGPVGLALDGSGNLFVCNCLGNYIARVRPDGAVQRFAESPELDCPNGITIDANGDLIVASFEHGRLVRVSPRGRAELWLEVPEGRNAHLVATPAGVFVTKIESNRIYRVTPSGEVEPFAGTGELGLEDGLALEATLSRPNGIAVAPDGGALFVNNLEGRWRGTSTTKIHLRRIDLSR